MTRVAPMAVMTVSPHGSFGYVRTSGDTGGCPKGYPCTHPGVDLLAPAGTPIRAPESGVVIARGDGLSPPFTGYNPFVVALLGDSGKYHLLAHMSMATAHLAPIGGRIAAGQVVGSVGVNHLHWELRTRVTPSSGSTNMQNNGDPLVWLASEGVGASDLGAIVVVGAAATLAFLLLRR